jgi:hypothetical protein
MTFDEFMRLVLASWPDAVIDEHGYGDELVIYTGHKLNGDNVVKMSDKEGEN